MTTFSMADSLAFRATLDTAAIKRGLGTVKREAVSTGKAMRQAFLPAAGAVAAVGAAMFGVVKSMSDAVDEANKLSAASGLSPETLGQIDFALQGVGLSVGEFREGLRTLVTRMTTSEAAFNALGVEVKDSTGALRTADEVIVETFAALGKVEGQTQRAAAAATVFGSETAALGVVMADLNDDMEAGAEFAAAMFGEEAQQASADFDKSMRNLNTSLTELKTTLAVEFTPAVVDAMDAVSALTGPLTEAWKAAKFMQDNFTPLGLILQAIGSSSEEAADGLEEVTETAPEIEETAIAVGKLADATGRLASIAAIRLQVTSDIATEEDLLIEKAFLQIGQVQELIKKTGEFHILKGAEAEIFARLDRDLEALDTRRSEAAETAHLADMERIARAADARRAEKDQRIRDAKEVARFQRMLATDLATAEINAIGAVANALLERSDLTAKEAKRAAKIAFAAQQATALTQIAISTIANISSAAAAFAFPSPAGIAAVIAVGILGATQAAAVLATQAPEFATGGFVPLPTQGSPDHGLVGLNVAPGESLSVNDRRSTADGSAARASRRTRDGMGGGETFTINTVWQGRTVDQVVYDTVRAPGTRTNAAIRAVAVQPRSHYAR